MRSIVHLGRELNIEIDFGLSRLLIVALLTQAMAQNHTGAWSDQAA